MQNRILNLFNRLATGRTILILLGLFIFFNAVIMPMVGAKIQEYSGGVGPFDLQFSYTPEQALTMLKAYGEQGRPLYALVDLTLDVVYPLVTFLLFGALLTFLLRRGFPNNATMQKLALLPLGTLLMDYLENVCVVTMLMTFPNTSTLVAQLSSLFTTTKWIFVGLTFVVTLIGAVAWLARKIQSK